MPACFFEAEVRSLDNKALLPFFLKVSFKRRKKIDSALDKNNMLMALNTQEIAKCYMKLNSYL